MTESETGMKATTLTKILVGSILLIACLTIAASWRLQGWLGAQIETTNTMRYEASMSDSNLAKAKGLKTYIDSHREELEQASTIVAESQTYSYQNQIINDLTSYAAASGVSILEFNFPESSSNSKKAAAGALKSISAEITLNEPLQYNNFIIFLKYIEQNRTKMQIADISISTNKENPRLIDSPTIGLEVYVK